MSAIARMFLHEGKKVSGSDRAASEITEALQKEGAKISIGEQRVGEIPKGTELIIYSAALPVAEADFLAKIKKLPIPSLSYSEALGEISKGKRTIAVSGTHGKTTVTAMIATILIDAGLSPSAIIGSVLLREKSNFVAGKSDWLVVEADEYRRSFLSLSPAILVMTNIDRDHLDYFKDMQDIQSAYAELAAKIQKQGAIVTDFSDDNIGPAVKVARAPLLDYASVAADGLKLKFPGAHNISNAKAALAVADFLDIPREVALQSLNNFQGTWRRFEHLGETASGALVYDDYAHNPQKIQALLAGVREKFPKKRVIAIFQPHLYSRTKTLLKEFAVSFHDADVVILAPIFPAREAPDPTISHEILAERIRQETGREVTTLSSFSDIAIYVQKIAKKGYIILTLGAGDIYKVGDILVK